jgi:lipopolysaccharide export system protein LptC
VSQAADRNRTIKQHWAEPGSRHDLVVRLMKFGLPVVIGIVLIILAVAPFEQRSEVGFILDKDKVDKAQERMRVDNARYSGTDSKGQNFEIVANSGIQQSSTVPIVTIAGMRARLDLAKGPLGIAARQGRYDLDAKTVAVDGPIAVRGPDGYRLSTRDVTVDFNQRTMQSQGPVSGSMELGEFTAGQLRADLDQKTVSLERGVRLKIRQGAVR